MRRMVIAGATLLVGLALGPSPALAQSSCVETDGTTTGPNGLLCFARGGLAVANDESSAVALDGGITLANARSAATSSGDGVAVGNAGGQAGAFGGGLALAQGEGFAITSASGPPACFGYQGAPPDPSFQAIAIDETGRICLSNGGVLLTLP